MGVKRVGSHTRRTPSGGTTRVDTYRQSFRDALRGERPSPVDRRRQQAKKKKKGDRKKGWLSPRRGWRRLMRAVDAARRRRKLTATVLALGGIAEIGGFLAARGTGALLMVTAMGLTALAGGLLALSRPDEGTQSGRHSARNPPRGTRGRRDTGQGAPTESPPPDPPPRGPAPRRGDGPTWVASERVWATPPPAASPAPGARGDATDSGGSGGGGADRPRSRRLDGMPETERDRRFFDHRESGYRGPIDQDGNRVDDENGWITETVRKRSEGFGLRR